MAADRGTTDHRFARRFAESLVAVIALLLLAAAWAANGAWLDHHFLPEHKAQPQLRQVATALRVLVLVLGLWLLLRVRGQVGRAAAAGRSLAMLGSVTRGVLAVVLALAASELILTVVKDARARHERPAEEEPQRQRDRDLGWINVPSRVGHEQRGGRGIDYAFDANGCRVRDAGSRVDPQLPTLVFTGESYMFGFGLPWNETVPARMEQMLGVQAANIAVNGYSTDQAWLHLAAELPRYPHPVAVVTLFASRLFVRNLETDRPHLDAHLQWHEGRLPYRLESLATRIVRYHGDAAIDEGVAMTRAVLRATIDLAKSRGAVPLVLVPQFQPESGPEREIRRRVLDEPGIPYVFVPLPADWKIPDDAHPDGRAAEAMAGALVEEFRKQQPP